MIRVLQVMGSLGWNGEANVVMNYYRHIKKERVQFDFVTNSVNPERFDDEVLMAGGKIYKMPGRNKPYKYLPALYKLIKNNRYSIVHLQHGSASMAMDGLVAKLCGVPVVIGHSHNTNTNILWQHHFFKVFVNRVVDYRFACSKDAGEWVFGKRKDIRIINNAIDLSNFSFDGVKREIVREKFSLNGKFVVGFVGRLAYQKNPLRIISIFSRLLKKQENCVLLLVGDGIMKSEMMEKASSDGCLEKVVFAGNRSDVNEMMMAMDVFLLPSIFEGMPLVGIEAQATGLPCVTSKSAGVIDCTGNVVSLNLEDDDDVWCDAILNSRVSDRTCVIENVRKAGFDIDVETGKMEEFYFKSLCHQ